MQRGRALHPCVHNASKSGECVAYTAFVALSPGIPTSFVPKQLSQPGPQRPVRSGTNLFLVVSLCIAGLMLVIAVGTFGYSKLLERKLVGKQADLAAAQAKINENTIDEFVRLRDRLTTGKELLNNHIVLSQFFDSLEKLTLQNVTFEDLKLTVANDRSAKLEMQGSARSFNALAAQSNALAGEKLIKRAIISGITIKDGLVTFKLTADIDPKLLVEGSGVAARGTQSTTPATAPPAATTTKPAAAPVAPAAAKPASTTPVTTP